MTHYHCFTRINSQENRFLTEIYNYECLHLFFICKSLEILRTMYQRYPGYFMADAYQNPRIVPFLVVLWNLTRKSWRLKADNLIIIWTFLILVDESSLGTKVFIKIEIISKMWWKKKQQRIIAFYVRHIETLVCKFCYSFR